MNPNKKLCASAVVPAAQPQPHIPTNEPNRTGLNSSADALSIYTPPDPAARFKIQALLITATREMQRGDMETAKVAAQMALEQIRELQVAEYADEMGIVSK